MKYQVVKILNKHDTGTGVAELVLYMFRKVLQTHRHTEVYIEVAPTDCSRRGVE